MENESLKLVAKQFIKDNRNEIISNLLRLVCIKSVSEYKPEDEFVFGEGCAEVLNEGALILNECGFETENHDYYYVTGKYSGKTKKEILLMAHLDVVPEGNGWSFPAFKSFYKDGFVFGRGALDNKGAAIVCLYALKFLKENKIILNHTITLFYGANEEAGMVDAKRYSMNSIQPELALIPDTGFPVCHAEKGIIETDIKTSIFDSNIIDFKGGIASNMVPDSAYVILKNIDYRSTELLYINRDEIIVSKVNQGVKIEAKGIGGHSAFPEGTVNAIILLINCLLSDNLITGIKTIQTFKFISNAFSDFFGEGLNIVFNDQISGNLTHVAGIIKIVDSDLFLNLNIRYPVSTDQNKMIYQLTSILNKNGFKIITLDNNKPMYVDSETPVIECLVKTVNEVLKTDLKPFSLAGGTYSRKIKNAVGFGAGTALKPNPFPEGKGGPHQPDEAVQIDMLCDAILIYILALIRVDKILLN